MIAASKTSGLQLLQIDDCSFQSEERTIVLPSTLSSSADLTNT